MSSMLHRLTCSRRGRTRGSLLALLCLLFIQAIEAFLRHTAVSSCSRSLHYLQQQPDADRESSSASPSSASSQPRSIPDGIRLNKVFKATHSRRQADDLIAGGRVTVNDRPVTSVGQRVVPFRDVVRLDGRVVQGWEAFNAAAEPPRAAEAAAAVGDPTGDAVGPFEYVKYWKPVGVTCTTDRRVRGNILDAVAVGGYHPQHRIYPVGRLDRDTSGLILLTSDGRLPNAVLRGRHKQPKAYDATVDGGPVGAAALDRLRAGVPITTVAHRDGRRGPPRTAPTLPCRVERRGPDRLRLTLTEGRNRQVRRMLEAVGHTVVTLERVAFAGIGLPPLRGPGDWARLSEGEMELIRGVIASAGAGAADEELER